MLSRPMQWRSFLFIESTNAGFVPQKVLEESLQRERMINLIEFGWFIK
jgi:hypothetical protein